MTAAALRCVARWGAAKTTLDDVAREAGLSRATVYRLFPGGKDALLAAVVAAELRRFFDGLADRLERAGDDLEDLLVAGITHTARTLAGHAALQTVLAHEPERLLPHLAFERLDAVLAAASELAAPYLERHVEPELARRTGEWVARMILSYTLAPSLRVDLTDDGDARRFTRTYVMPALTVTV